MYEIKIYDPQTKKEWSENFESYGLFKRRYFRLRYGKKLWILFHSNLID